MKIKLFPLSLVLVLALARSLQADGAHGPPSDQTVKLLRETTLMMLKEGNARFAAGKPQHPNQTPERRVTTATEGQEPLATVLACSDSREPVELIFDRGVGELFVVRVAGNTADTDQIATIEYGVAHLHTPLLLVMGHTRCGAVTAVVKGAELHGHLPKLAAKIKPAAEKAKALGGLTDEIIAEAIRANVWQSVADVLRRSDIVREKVRSGAVQVVGAVYDLEHGSVKWMGTHPELDSLLATVAPAEDSPGANEAGDGHGKAAPAPQKHTALAPSFLGGLRPNQEPPPADRAAGHAEKPAAKKH